MVAQMGVCVCVWKLWTTIIKRLLLLLSYRLNNSFIFGGWQHSLGGGRRFVAHFMQPHRDWISLIFVVLPGRFSLNKLFIPYAAWIFISMIIYSLSVCGDVWLKWIFENIYFVLAYNGVMTTNDHIPHPIGVPRASSDPAPPASDFRNIYFILHACKMHHNDDVRICVRLGAVWLYVYAAVIMLCQSFQLLFVRQMRGFVSTGDIPIIYAESQVPLDSDDEAAS